MNHDCQRCGAELHYTTSGQGGRNRLYCSAECRDAEKAELRQIHNKALRRRCNHTIDTHRPVLVRYPDVDGVDRWTRHDYELYRHELPAGATVEFAT